MNLFVLVSTGQKVANLPPTLEHARPGDHVLWVESREASDGKWTAAPRDVLESRGLVTAATVPVSGVNDPVSLAAALAPFAKDSGDQYDVVYLVANGGTKLSPVGLLRGFEALNPRLLYGDEKPAVHSLYPPGLNAPPDVLPYTHHDLDLPDVLRLNGFTFASDSAHARIWPDPLPQACAAEPYGVDETITYQMHADHHAWNALPPTGQRVPHAQLPALLGAQYTSWTNTIRNTWNARQLTPDRLNDVYSATLNLDERARRAARGGAAPPVRIGPAFERAVCRRVRAWLDGTRHGAVRSVWVNARVARETSPHKCEAEYDVLVVLTNGVLVHLECKSAAVDVRDLDAQVHRLRQTGSQLARLAVVLPQYTTQVTQSWFATLHAARTQLVEARLLLPFTWPGQPGRYVMPSSDPVQEVECPEFEAALEKLLSTYRPPIPNHVNL